MEHLFTDTVTISREVVTGNKTTYAEATSIPCHIQPLSDSYIQGTMGRDGKDFRMYSTTEVFIGDRLVDQNSKEFEITGVATLAFRARKHYQSTLRGV